MAIKTYLYQANLTAADLGPLLATTTAVVVGDPLPNSQVPITIDEANKDDLDDAMEELGYTFIAEWLGTTLTSRTDYGVSLADPVVIAANGDMYYNSALDMEMRYDSVRAKWLSVESSDFHFGRGNRVPPGDYFRATGNRVMSASEGLLAVRSGTIVSFGYTRFNGLAASFDIVENGVSLQTVATTSLTGRNITLDLDFSFTSVLAVRNAPASANPLRNVIGWIRIKWRV